VRICRARHLRAGVGSRKRRRLARSYEACAPGFRPFTATRSHSRTTQNNRSDQTQQWNRATHGERDATNGDVRQTVKPGAHDKWRRAVVKHMRHVLWLRKWSHGDEVRLAEICLHIETWPVPKGEVALRASLQPGHHFRMIEPAPEASNFTQPITSKTRSLGDTQSLRAPGQPCHDNRAPQSSKN